MSIVKNNNDNLYSSSMLDLISNIVEVVVNSYFYWVDDYAFKQDLMQEGFLKAYELLKTGNYDPNQNLLNYLFTGVRNAMTNLNYHNNKERHSSYNLYQDNEDYLQDVALVQRNTYTSYYIDIDTIISSCDKFAHKDYVGNVIEYLNTLGMSVNNTTRYDALPEPNKFVFRAIIVDIMWGIRDEV